MNPSAIAHDATTPKTTTAAAADLIAVFMSDLPMV